MTPEELRVHRELEYLRAAGRSAAVKPSRWRRARMRPMAAKSRRISEIAAERFAKWQETNGDAT